MRWGLSRPTEAFGRNTLDGLSTRPTIRGVDQKTTLREFQKYRPSAQVLIAVNLLPLIGVFLFDWDVFAIVLLYWAENVILGGINVLKMLTPTGDAAAARDDRTRDAQGRLQRGQAETITYRGRRIRTAHHAPKFFLVPFFIVHYGGFCLGHGIFIVALLGSGGKFPGPDPGPGGMMGRFTDTLFSGPMLLAVLGLGASHLYSFFVNFLGRGEYRKTGIPLLMSLPYGRIFVLHIAIILGAFATLLLGSPTALLAVLVAGKIVLDLKFHLRERRKLAELSVEG